MTKVINAPTEIWLNYGDDIFDGPVNHNECGIEEIGWTQGSAATDFNQRYVRADLHEALQAQLAEAKADDMRACAGWGKAIARIGELSEQLIALQDENVRLHRALGSPIGGSMTDKNQTQNERALSQAAAVPEGSVVVPKSTVDDLSALVAKLAHYLKNVNKNHMVAAAALDYLKRKGLEGSPLRDATMPPRQPARGCVCDLPIHPVCDQQHSEAHRGRCGNWMQKHGLVCGHSRACHGESR